jgi:hypothetical protein
MDPILENIIQIVQSLGFPICMTFLIFWRMNKESDQHKTEVDTLKDTIAENTKVLAQLQQLIEDKLND